MSYKALHAHCQGLPLHIRRNAVRDTVFELTGARCREVRTGMDPAICRGFYLSAGNTGHRLVQQHGSCVIVLARGLDEAMERFIYLKELMHMFDDPADAIDSGEKFEALLSEFSGTGDPEWSPHMLAEFSSFWMALGVLCPQEHRLEMKTKRANGEVEDAEIAARLKMPVQYIARLLDDKYDPLMAKLLESGNLKKG